MCTYFKKSLFGIYRHKLFVERELQNIACSESTFPAGDTG